MILVNPDDSIQLFDSLGNLMSQKSNDGISMNFKTLNHKNNKYVKVYDNNNKL